MSKSLSLYHKALSYCDLYFLSDLRDTLYGNNDSVHLHKDEMIEDITAKQAFFPLEPLEIDDIVIGLAGKVYKVAKKTNQNSFLLLDLETASMAIYDFPVLKVDKITYDGNFEYNELDTLEYKNVLAREKVVDENDHILYLSTLFIHDADEFSLIHKYL